MSDIPNLEENISDGMTDSIENIEDSTASDPDDLSTSELWDEIGFHKPIAGFWFNIVYTLLSIVVSMTFAGYLMNFFYPFPESFGYKDIVFGYFALMFMVFDIGTGAVMGRFIPEVNIKDPQKMLHMVQYFIWYQMITGLIQTTIISVYALYFASEGSMGYTIWIMLIASTTQFPGFLGVFKNVLDALQHYDKTRTLSFATGVVLQNITQFGFVYLGRLYGESHPGVGAIMGIAIGAAIGLYIDDFFATMLSAYYFNKIMKQYGITPGHCFHVEFTWAEIKPILIFSLKVGLPGLITGPLGFLSLMLNIEYIPQYTTLMIMAYIGGSIADIMNWFGGAGIAALVAESYMNDKPKLTQYYIGQEVRFNTLIIGFFAPLIIVISFVMPVAWEELGMLNYVAGTFFVIPRLIRLCIQRFVNLPGSIMSGANKPEFGIIVGLINSVLALGLQYLYLAVWKIPQNYGIGATALIIELGAMPLTIFFSALSFIYINKKIIKIIIPWKQMIFGMILPALLTFLVMYLGKIFIFDTLYANYNFYAALIPSVIMLGSVLFIVYFPLTALLGAWDDTNLEEFRKAAIMSGPSKRLVMPLYNAIAKICARSKYHNRFALPMEGVEKAARELLLIKRTKRELLKQELDINK
jgi:hypothetical protein